MWVVDNENGDIIYIGHTYGECLNIVSIHDFHQETSRNKTKWRVRWETDTSKTVVR